MNKMQVRRALPGAVIICLAFFSAAVPLFTARNCQAVPANPAYFQVDQPGLGTFRVLQKGDEFNSWIETDDGYAILRERASGLWQYADVDSSGSLVNSGFLLGYDRPEAHGIQRDLGRASALLRAPRDRTALAVPGRTGRETLLSGPGEPAAHYVLALLAYFDDQSSAGAATEDMAGVIFGESGSVADYFREVSYGALEIVPAHESFGSADGVVGWIRLDGNHPNTGSSIDNGNRWVVHDALAAADAYVDFSLFDEDGDGYISSLELSLIVVVAGYERAYAAVYSPSVWAHRWSLGFSYMGETVPAPQLDGVTVGGYQRAGGYVQIGEWHQMSPTSGHPATTGIIAHELGHDLGLPDLYDTDGSSRGIGAFGLMAQGSWGNATDQIYHFGATPVHLSAWSKEFLGFVDPVVIQETTLGAVLPAAASGQTVYKIETEDPNQYFLLENRSPAGYDAGLTRWNVDTGGLAIWHVDLSVSSNRDESHKMVDLEEAEDGYAAGSELDDNINYGDEDDLFKAGWADPFDDDHAPDARLYDGTPTGIAVSNISDPGSSMTLDITVFQDQNPPPPPPVSELVISGNRRAASVELSWTGGTVENTFFYRVFRGTSQEGPFDLVGEVFRTGYGEKPPVFDDLFYTVCAVDGEGSEGPLADPILLAGLATAEDADGDGLVDQVESDWGTDHLNPDSDGDGFGDGEEVHLGFAPSDGTMHPGSEYDRDGDSLTDEEEKYLYFTNPQDADGDDDGLTDYEEIFVTGTDPNHPFSPEGGV